jgi:uncharacterized NAD(P)/FAD-binding protein YdhS
LTAADLRLLAPGRRRVVVVGGGASGTLVALATLRAIPNAAVTIVEPRSQLGRGLAYSTADPRHRLNVPAASMSALPDDPGHFLRWAGAHHRSVSPIWFAPRPTYGLYLAASLREAAARAPAADLRHLRSSAGAIDPVRGGWRVRLQSGHELVADEVVLALGYGPPAAPAGLPAEVLEHPGYVADPWRPDALGGAAGDVLCMGTGLTAVDAALVLADADLGRRIVCISRTGLRPLAHRSGGAAPAPRGSALRPVTAIGLLRSVRAEVTLAGERGGDWRDVVNGLRPHVNDLWAALPVAERERFRHRLARFWEVHRHRMPPQIANRIGQLEDDGQLCFLAARVERAEQRGSQLRLTLVETTGGRRVVSVGAVVNCTGAAASIAAHPLLGRLARDGLCTPGSLGLGIATTAGGQLLTSHGVASGLYTLGPLRRGDLWETTAVPEIRQQAFAIARALADRAGDRGHLRAG